jgi:trehalose/maltose hydrolase-like predicted phosphorylase
MRESLAPTGDPAWVLRAEGYDPLREASLESRFAISNGFLGVRGTRLIARGDGRAIAARTYVAGLFGTADGEGVLPGLVVAPDWLRVGLCLAGRPLAGQPPDVAAHTRILDFRRGALLTETRLRLADPMVAGLALRVRTLRLVSQRARGVGLQLIQFEFETGEAEVTLEASMEAPGLGVVEEQAEPDFGVWRAEGAIRRLAMATCADVQIDGADVASTPGLDPGARAWTWPARPGQLAVFTRLLGAVRSDTQARDPGPEARRLLGAAQQSGWSGVLGGHEAAWTERWRGSDVEVEGDAAAQEALRFAAYHLNSAANPDDERVSIAARALTGDDYRGHVFWDTEIYLLPFYTMTWPAAARALLMYRFHTLDGARVKAAGMGWRGALYAWESADTGAETTPREAVGPDRKIIAILSGVQEQHISADVAYAVWRYWDATGDEAFLREAGAEILIETARFWVSRATLESDGARHIRGVIGPDEYHEHIDDNAFTNVMARWNLSRAVEAATLLRTRWPSEWMTLSDRLDLGAAEIADWSAAAEALVTGLDPATGLYDQFEGFRELEDIDLAAYDGRSVPMDVVLGRERTQRTQVVKQADVVALLGLLPEAFTNSSAQANFDYYARRCSHGSSLSRAMHGLVAARLGLSDMALDFFRQTAQIDLGDAHVAIDGGLHIAALGGLWILAVFGFAGLSLTKTGIGLAPRLPAQWSDLRFPIQWRGRCVSLRIAQAKGLIEATLTSGSAMTLTLGGETHDLTLGQALRVSIVSTSTTPVQSPESPLPRRPALSPLR